MMILKLDKNLPTNHIKSIQTSSTFHTGNLKKKITGQKHDILFSMSTIYK